ncbi:EamA family transporter [Brevibacterium luteolum]|uniref:EamA family transporter n=1 Tax=Brevibacterium luteolum TaxID=199591 RepID=UPI003879E7D8
MSIRDVFIALGVVVLWGINFLFIDLGVQDWPPLLLVVARFIVVVFPAVFFVPFPRGRFGRVLLVGLFMSAGQFGLLYVAMSMGLPPGLASILLQMQAVFTTIVAVIVLREWPRARSVIGIIIGVAGLAVIIAGRTAGVPAIAVVVVLAAALSWGIGNVAARGAGVGGVSLTIWSATVVPIPLFVLSLIIDGPAAVGTALANPTWGVVASTAYTALCASLIGYVAWNTLLGRYAAAEVAPFTLLVPVIGVTSAWLVKGDVPAVAEVAGGCLLLLGVAVTTGVIGRRRTQKRQGRTQIECDPDDDAEPAGS